MSKVRGRWLKKDKTSTAKHGKELRWQATWTGGAKEVVKSHRTKDGAWN